MTKAINTNSPTKRLHDSTVNRLRKACAEARENALASRAFSVIVIDELDTMARRCEQHHRQTVSQLLAEMQGFSERGSVITIAATNRLEMLDPAVVSPGRLDIKWKR